MNAYPLTQEQIDFYRTNGFVQLDGVLTGDALETLQQAADEALQAQFDTSVDLSSQNPEYRKIFDQRINLWRVSEGIRQHVLNPRIAQIAAQLSGVTPVRIWHDHLLTKLPGDSKASAWHQDLPYWPFINEHMLSCWMALDDVTEARGCMQFIPQSHSWGLLEPINLMDPQDIFALAQRPEAAQPPYVAEMKAGSCTFHNGMTWHYAGPNRTDQRRRALVTIYMPGEAVYDGRPHVVTNGLGLTPGQHLEGDVFPVVFG